MQKSYLAALIVSYATVLLLGVIAGMALPPAQPDGSRDATEQSKPVEQARSHIPLPRSDGSIALSDLDDVVVRSGGVDEQKIWHAIRVDANGYPICSLEKPR